MDDDGKVKDPDWENRILCSDESCIGVVGPDGRCKECGKPYQLRQVQDQAGAHVQESVPNQGLIVEPQDADFDQQNPIGRPAGNDDDWERRVLCRDERCIGVIGPDGRCKECGRPYME